MRKTTDDGRGTRDATTYIGSLYEVDSNGVIRKHIYAGANRVCTVTNDQARQTTDSSYYHSDHLGSSSVITDAGGNQVESYEYTPYGSVASSVVSRPSSLVHHKFTGKEIDSSGLYFYGARYYDPETGRFITADTIVQAPYDPQSLNRYSYARNNPVNYVDPTGHFWAQLIWAIVVIAAGWGVAQAGAEVNVSAGVTVPFDTGPSNSRSSYSSVTSSPSAGAPTGAGSAGAGNTITSGEGKAGSTQPAILPPGYEPVESASGSRQFNNDADTLSSSPSGLDIISSPWVQMPISGATKAGSASYGIWKNTLKEYAPGWTKGIGRAQGFQNIFQGLGILQNSMYYAQLYEKAASQNLSQPQIQASSLIHGTGFGLGMLATEGGKWAGRAG